MGRISGQWPAGDGAPRPPGRKSDHPQDQRQDLSHPSGQKRGKSGLRAEAVSFLPISAPTGSQIVTPHLAPSRPPYWYPFSPPPTPRSYTCGNLTVACRRRESNLLWLLLIAVIIDLGGLGGGAR